MEVYSWKWKKTMKESKEIWKDVMYYGDKKHFLIFGSNSGFKLAEWFIAYNFECPSFFIHKT